MVTATSSLEGSTLTLVAGLVRCGLLIVWLGKLVGHFTNLLFGFRQLFPCSAKQFAHIACALAIEARIDHATLDLGRGNHLVKRSSR